MGIYRVGGRGLSVTNVYCVSGTEVQEWTVIRRTAKTAVISREMAPGWAPWTRTIRATLIDQAGAAWFTTPEAALETAIELKRIDVERVKERLQRGRTVLGMLESELKKRRKSATSLDAVDPVEGIDTDCPRA